MSSNSLAIIAAALGNVSSAISERLRQEGSGSPPPFPHVAECIDEEAQRLRAEGQNALADALAALRDA